MPQRETLRIKGYREFLIACDNAGRETKYRVRNTFREVGNVVKVEATEKFAPYDLKSALGYRTVVRTRGVSVEQKYRKTTGARPNFGPLQMRKALVPALQENESVVEARMERALDKIADHFERTP